MAAMNSFCDFRLY